MAAILKWMFVLVLLITVAGGGAAYWFYFRSDEAIRLLVLEQLRNAAPTVKFDIGRANFDPSSNRVRIYGLTAFLPGDDYGHPSLEVPEIIATLDPDQLTDLTSVVVQKLDIVKPKLNLTRSPDGQWNWPQIAVQATPGASPPQIEIEHASILTKVQLPNQTARELRFKNFNVSVHPADSKRLTIQVATLFGPSEPLTLEIDVALDGSTWKCESRDAWRIPVDRGLVQLICDLSPQVAAKVATIGPWLDKAKAMQAAVGSSPMPSSSQLKTESQSNATVVVPDFGVRCVCDLNFRLQQDGRDQPMAFNVLAKIVSGEINNGLLPFPFTDLGGTIYVDDRKIIVEALQASSGETRIVFDGDVIPSKPMTATVKVRGVELTDALKSRLPEGLRRVVQSLALTGICDAKATATQNGGTWDYQVDLSLTNGTVTHERFLVTARDVSGKLKIKDGVLKFAATGIHAGQTVEAHGTIINPGPEQQGDIIVTGKNLPLDDESLAACPPPVYSSIKALNLKGQHDVRLRVTRPAGQHHKWEPELEVRLREGSLSFKDFPYAIQQLQGIVKWKGDAVSFEKLSGTHNGATLTGGGSFQRIPGRGLLELSIKAENAAFDRSLKIALPSMLLQQIWNGFQPQGNFDVETKISWVPGRPCVVKLPKVTVRDGEITMQCFPWPLRNLTGSFTYNLEPGKLEIVNLQAYHDATQLNANGIGWFKSQEPWQMDFSQLNVDSLKPDATFRKSLPEVLRKTFDFLQPTGVYSFDGPVSFYGPRRENDSVGAVWKLKTVLSDCSIKAGTPIDGINGVVKLVGKWNGDDATLDGELDLDSLWIYRQPSSQGYQITNVRGPISYHDRKFIAGTETAILIPRLSTNYDETKRIRGKFIDGTVYLDADVNLANEPEYQTFVELKRGRLDEYAQQYLRRHSGLKGIMNGWMKLKGKGTDADRMVGEGRLVIAQAALYDSPLFAQIFQLMQLKSPDKTAFENAQVNFTVGSGRFDLNQLELQGDTLSMRGRGYVRFDGKMQMNFGVYLMRQMLPNPYRLSAVEVTGIVGDPRVRIVPLLELDGPFKQFLTSFDPRKMAPPPGLFSPLVPRTGQSSDPTAK